MPKIDIEVEDAPVVGFIGGQPRGGWEPDKLPDWLEKVDEEKPWLVPHLIPRDSLVLLSGQQKLTYKTFFAFSAAVSLASGKPHSYIKSATPGERLPVLIIEEEGSSGETKARLLAICKSMGVDPKSLDNVLWVFRQRVKLDQREWRERLIDTVQKYKPVLTVLDAMYCLHEGDENSASEMQPVFDTFQAMRSEGGSLLYLAHLDKARGWSKNSDIDNQVRGSSSLVNIYDVHLAARRYDESEMVVGMKVRMRGGLTRVYDITWDFENELVGDEYQLRQAVLTMTEKDSKEERKEKAIDRLEAGKEYTQTELKKAWGCTAHQATQTLLGLVSDGCLRKVDGGRFRYIPKEQQIVVDTDNQQE